MKNITCPACSGRRIVSGYLCDTCKGAGEVYVYSRSPVQPVRKKSDRHPDYPDHCHSDHRPDHYPVIPIRSSGASQAHAQREPKRLTPFERMAVFAVIAVMIYGLFAGKYHGADQWSEADRIAAEIRIQLEKASDFAGRRVITRGLFPCLEKIDSLREQLYGLDPEKAQATVRTELDLLNSFAADFRATDYGSKADILEIRIGALRGGQ